MMHIGKALLLAGVLAVTGPALAVAPARVEAVQMPAWFDRGGQTRPLAIDTEVKHGDKLRTGKSGRAQLKLADGSTVKLGEGATLAIYTRSLQPERHFKGALDVLAGAFRYTTGVARSAGGGRDLSIRVGVVTAGIRGTDLWGKSDAERDLVCLIEGRIELTQAGQATNMDQALSFYVAPRGAPALPLAQVDPEQLQRWARETEMLPGDGASRGRGRWKLLLGSPEDERQALALYDGARDAGYAATIKPRAAGASGKWIYDVMIERVDSEADAGVLAARLLADAKLEAGIVR